MDTDKKVHLIKGHRMRYILIGKKNIHRIIRELLDEPPFPQAVTEPSIVLLELSAPCSHAVAIPPSWHQRDPSSTFISARYTLVQEAKTALPATL